MKYRSLIAARLFISQEFACTELMKVWKSQVRKTTITKKYLSSNVSAIQGCPFLTCRKFSQVLGHCDNEYSKKCERFTDTLDSQPWSNIREHTSLTKSSSLIRPRMGAPAPSPSATSRKTTAFPRSTASITAGSGPVALGIAGDCSNGATADMGFNFFSFCSNNSADKGGGLQIKVVEWLAQSMGWCYLLLLLIDFAYLLVIGRSEFRKIWQINSK